MSTDKRTVHTDALETLGTIITDKEKRDAIHLAVEPVVAGEELKPGEHVGFFEDGTAGKYGSAIGIVDPFLNKNVQKGKHFWLVVYPRQITSLRHIWEHPAFPASNCFIDLKAIDASKQWIRSYAVGLEISYERLMGGAEEYLITGEITVSGGYNLEGECTSDEFWVHYEIVTGTKVAEEQRGNFFKCAC